MYDQFKRARRAQRQGSHGTDAKFILLLLAIVALLASAAFNWGVQSTLTGSLPVALGMTALLTLAPPTLMSFMIPWSPGGMLLQRINGRTWGQAAVGVCALFLVYYAYSTQVEWWIAQPNTAAAGMAQRQAIVCIIGFIVIPALLWAPVSDDELAATLKQAQAVKRYEIQVAADIAILQATLLNAQKKALIGFANLTSDEGAELAAVMRGLVVGIDQMQQEIAGNFSAATGLAMSVQTLEDDPAIAQLLDQATDAFTRVRMVPNDAPTVSYAPPAAPRSDALESVGTMSTNATVVAQPDAGQRRVTHPDAGIRKRALVGLAPAWTTKELATALDVAESTARERVASWLSRGLIQKEGLRGRHSFTELGRADFAELEAEV